MECKQCRQQYDETMNMCPYCGTANDAQQRGAQQNQNGQIQQQQPYQAQYQQQYQPGQMQHQQVPDNTAKGLGIGAMVCGIIGVVTCMIPILAIILGVVGIVLGNMARKKLPAGQTGMATTGFVCGIIAVALGVVVWIMFVALFIGLTSASYDFLDMMEYYY